MLKTFGAALVLAAGLAATPALALQTVVTQVDKNADGSMTYHFAVKLDQGEIVGQFQRHQGRPGKYIADIAHLNVTERSN